MEKVVNQLGQTIKIPSLFHYIKIEGNVIEWKREDVFKDSEFNPVLLADGSIIPHYRYNGQPIKRTSQQRVRVVFDAEMWEIYILGESLPFKGKPTFEEVEKFCSKKGYIIEEVDDSNLE